jgi:hypothetical protein
MRLQAKAGTVKTFAVIIDKSKCATADDVRATAWRHTLERVEVFARHNNETVMLVPDSGEYDRFRKLARRMRRHSQVGAMVGGGTLSRPLARYLIDDPVERDSAQSYFVQLADLNAYAAYRKEVPDPLFPATMWDELGLAILTEANENLVATESSVPASCEDPVRKEPPGITGGRKPGLLPAKRDRGQSAAPRLVAPPDVWGTSGGTRAS